MRKKGLGIAAAGLLVLALLAAVYAVRVVRSLDTPEFKQALLEQARQSLGVPVQARELRVSVFRGAELKGVTVSNPPGFQGPLLTADSFALRYDLWPLLRGRIQVDELVLKRPALELAVDGRGVFNYEKLGPARAAAKGRAPSGPRGLASAPLEVVLSRLAVEDARVTVTDARRAVLMKAEGASLNSSFRVRGGSAQGSGTSRIDALGLGGVLSVRDVSAPVAISAEKVSLAPIRGRLGGGQASGSLELDLARSGYSVRLEVDGAAVDQLQKEAGGAPTLSGRLRANGTFEGAGGLATLKGRGQAEVRDCRAARAPLLKALAMALQLPELADPDFDECRAEFTIGGGQARTPVLSLKGRSVRLTGHGSMTLDSGALDYDMTLALARALLDRIPAREVRAAFAETADGFGSLEFRVTGTAAAPHTDVLARVGKASAIAVVKGKLGGLFRKKN